MVLRWQRRGRVGRCRGKSTKGAIAAPFAHLGGFAREPAPTRDPERSAGDRGQQRQRLAAVRDDDGIAELVEELHDRYGDIPQPVLNLIEVAKFRNHARRAGLHDVTLQGNLIRFGPVELPDSKVLRLNRLYPKSLVKPQLRTILVPRPATRPVAGQPLRDQELLQWCTRLIDDVIAEPVATLERLRLVSLDVHFHEVEAWQVAEQVVENDRLHEVAALHRLARADQIRGRIRQRHMQRDDIRTAQHFVERRLDKHHPIAQLDDHAVVRSGLAAFLADVSRLRLGQTIRLQPLAAADTGRLIRAMLDLQGTLPPALLHEIMAVTGGNPYLVEELVHTLVQRGDLAPEGSGWRFRPGATVAVVVASAFEASVSPSTSVSFAASELRSVSCAVSSSVANESATAIGASLTGVIVMLTVALACPPSSETVTVNVSVPL